MSASHIFAIVILIITTLLGILGFLIKGKIDRMEKDIEHANTNIEKVDAENQELKNNYLSRFEKVYSTMNNMDRGIRENIHESKVEIIKEFSKLANQIHGRRK